MHGDLLRGIPSHYPYRTMRHVIHKWEELEPTFGPPLHQKYRSVFRAGVKLQTSNETREAPKASGNG